MALGLDKSCTHNFEFLQPPPFAHSTVQFYPYHGIMVREWSLV